jgi:hypothetical protein
MNKAIKQSLKDIVGAENFTDWAGLKLRGMGMVQQRAESASAGTGLRYAP